MRDTRRPMANPEHVEIVRRGTEAIEKWRLQHPEISLELTSAKLTWVSLFEADLSETNLSEADLAGADLARAKLFQTNLS